MIFIILLQGDYFQAMAIGKEVCLTLQQATQLGERHRAQETVAPLAASSAAHQVFHLAVQ